MSASPMVRAVGVHKRFGLNEVLRGIDLEVQRGEVMCVIGPSGSGKTTLLRCINHLEQISGGRLYVDGVLMGYRERGDKLHEIHPREAARPTWSSSRCAASTACSFGTPFTRVGASMMLASTVMWGKRLKCWNTMPMFARIFATSRSESS